mmetsp:Transcript_177611/g.569591  ORF Transcript_177611/g.569591 Transcript_177611/m.569591 type:complete len:104 (-) Transcript_177611:90-401(-)
MRMLMFHKACGSSLKHSESPRDLWLADAHRFVSNIAHHILGLYPHSHTLSYRHLVEVRDGLALQPLELKEGIEQVDELCTYLSSGCMFAAVPRMNMKFEATCS